MEEKAFQVVFETKLAACQLNEKFLRRLYLRLSEDNKVTCRAKVIRGCDILGRREWETKERFFHKWEDLCDNLKEDAPADKLELIYAIANRGEVAIKFDNCYPVSGILKVEGLYAEWAKPLFEDLVAIRSQGALTKRTALYSKLGFTFVHSVIPLLLAFVVVTSLCIILIPYEYRSGNWLWWVTALSLLFTLRVGYSFSDWMMNGVLKRYPFWEWSYQKTNLS